MGDDGQKKRKKNPLTLATSGAPDECPVLTTVSVPLALSPQSEKALTAPRGDVELTLMAPDARVRGIGGTMSLLLASSPCANTEEEEQASPKKSSSSTATAGAARRHMRIGEREEREERREREGKEKKKDGK